MPVNDFEKQVQQKMHELKFVPSDAVWPAVEREINQHKKRRVLFIWLPLLLLLLGGTLWLYRPGMQHAANKHPVAANSSNSITIKTDNTKNSSAVARPAHEQATSASAAKSNTAPLPSGANKATLPANESQQKNNSNVESALNRNAVKKELVADGGSQHQHSIHSPKNTGKAGNSFATVKKAFHKTIEPAKASHSILQKEQTGETAGVDAETTGSTTPSIKIAKSEKQAAVVNSPVAEAVIEDSTSGNQSKNIAGQVAKESLQNMRKADTAKAIVQTKKTRAAQKIAWGISLQTGVSSVSSGFPGLFSSSRYFDPATFANSVNNNPGNITGGTASSAASSAIRPGFSYAAGAFFRKPLGKRYSLQAGLNFNYYSSHVNTGAKIDTVAPMLQYRSGNAYPFTNRFYFIELPVTVEKEFGKTSRFAVNGGLSFSWLAGSRALLYDAQHSVYTADKSLLNHFQLAVRAGVSYRFFPASIPVEMGPQLNYNMSSIFRKDLYGSRQLFFGGVQAKIMLHKK